MLDDKGLGIAAALAQEFIDKVSGREIPVEVLLCAGLIFADSALRYHIEPDSRMLPAIDMASRFLRSVAMGVSEDITAHLKPFDDDDDDEEGEDTTTTPAPKPN